MTNYQKYLLFRGLALILFMVSTKSGILREGIAKETQELLAKEADSCLAKHVTKTKVITKT